MKNEKTFHNTNLQELRTFRPFGWVSIPTQGNNLNPMFRGVWRECGSQALLCSLNNNLKVKCQVLVVSIGLEILSSHRSVDNLP